jgi:hypothetical protein
MPRAAGRSPDERLCRSGDRDGRAQSPREAPSRWCAEEGEAAGMRPQEPAANAASPPSAAGKEEGWREQEAAAARSRSGGGRGAGAGRKSEAGESTSSNTRIGIVYPVFLDGEAMREASGE